jgi:membrane-associated protease RseP (regulator of RpoE activity)
MNTTALSFIIMVVASIAGIVYHEYGHMRAAKKNNITVKTFCIGFGKPLLHHRGKDGVTYGITPLLIGGYCSLDDEALNKSSLRVYVSVLLAGVIRNFIFGTILIVIGQLLIANGFVNPVTLFQNAMQCFLSLLSSFGDAIKNMLNLKTMASYGGFVSQMSETSTTISAASKTIKHVIGMSLMMGGLMNYMLFIFNVLPVPGLDGGQIAVRLVCNFCKKVFNRRIKQQIIMAVNFAVMAILCCYQGLILLFDVPLVRNLFLNL